jgi:DNA (cytosine-5)-methyltransferase 1
LFAKDETSIGYVVKPKKKRMRLADLFSGTGSAIYASKRLPIHSCFSNDFCTNSKKIFETNFSCKFSNISIHDIEAKELPDHDILVAGFPCQPYSVAGRREGLRDSRSHVFNDILRVAGAKKPRFMVLENVKHLVSIDKGATLESC